MAQGRMINRRIAKSNKFKELKYDRSRVLYFMIYPWLDCEGRYSADPDDIKEDCCPRLRYSKRQIAESIIDLANIGLLMLYEDDDGVTYLEYTRFEEFQIGLKKNREAPSKIPIPDLVRINSGVTPSLYLSLSLYLKKVGKEDNRILYDHENIELINISDKQKEAWKKAYPACDINFEINKMASWLDANPTKRKKNYKAFINNWLSRQQDGGGTKKGSCSKKTSDMTPEEYNEYQKKHIGGGRD